VSERLLSVGGRSTGNDGRLALASGASEMRQIETCQAFGRHAKAFGDEQRPVAECLAVGAVIFTTSAPTCTASDHWIPGLRRFSGSCGLSPADRSSSIWSWGEPEWQPSVAPFMASALTLESLSASPVLTSPEARTSLRRLLRTEPTTTLSHVLPMPHSVPAQRWPRRCLESCWGSSNVQSLVLSSGSKSHDRKSDSACLNANKLPRIKLIICLQ